MIRWALSVAFLIATTITLAASTQAQQLTYTCPNGGEIVTDPSKCPVPLGQAYTITDLGVPFTLNDTDSHASAINASGTVTGYAGDYSNALELTGFLNQDAFIWVPDSKNGTTGTMTSLGGLPGDYCFNPEHTVGGLTTPGGFVQFPSVPQAINSAGQIVGWSYTASDGLCPDASR